MTIIYKFPVHKLTFLVSKDEMYLWIDQSSRSGTPFIRTYQQYCNLLFNMQKIFSRCIADRSFSGAKQGNGSAVSAAMKLKANVSY